MAFILQALFQLPLSPARVLGTPRVLILSENTISLFFVAPVTQTSPVIDQIYAD